jgi:hypothetical protein
MPFFVSRLLSVVVVFFALCALRVGAQEPQGKLITFDVRGASTLPFYGTQPFANNDFGLVVGYYTDTNIVPHGFFRTPKGEIVSFDAPGADTTAGLDRGTVAYSVNDWGAIAGQLQDCTGLFHGFIRYPDGSFVTFNPPCKNCGNGQGAYGTANINIQGAVAGYFADASGNYHGFVRSPGGKITTFDAPNGVGTTIVCLETCLNASGEITGWYADMKGTHGFVRYADGKIDTFDGPKSVAARNMYTIGASINDQGEITGYYLGEDLVYHSYIRTRDGKIKEFDVTSVENDEYEGTFAVAINAFGAVTGIYSDETNVNHGFERWPDGSITTFDVPQNNIGSNQGTRPSTNNAYGQVAGWYTDGNNLNHGFIWCPKDDCESTR